jgi:hypothetical protein
MVSNDSIPNLVTLQLCLCTVGMKISAKAAAALSEGIQIYAKNLLESAMEHRRCRINETATKSFMAVHRMIAAGRGNPLPENQANVALVWSGRDAMRVAAREESFAKKFIAAQNAADEKELIREMKAKDESILSKRKVYQGVASTPDVNATTWWTLEVIAPSLPTSMHYMP